MVVGGVVETDFAGGVETIVSGLKTWVETGEPLMPAVAASSEV